MSLPTEEVAQFVPEPAVDHATLEVGRDRLDFIPDDPDELRRAVTDMAARINLADWRFIKLIAAMERTRGWRDGGYCNLGNWLDHQCGLGPCAARERIRIGRALERLPRIDAAFRDGAISYSKVRAITRVATPDTDAMLLAIAEGSSAAQLESLVRTYERVGGSGSGRASSEERRSLSWHYEDGMLVITAAVPAERGALVINALQRIVDGRRDESEARHAALLTATCQRQTTEPAGEEGPDGAPGIESITTGVPTDVSAETQVDHASGHDVSAQASSAALIEVDASGDVSAETDARTGWSSRGRAGNSATPTPWWTWPSTAWRARAAGSVATRAGATK